MCSDYNGTERVCPMSPQILPVIGAGCQTFTHREIRNLMLSHHPSTLYHEPSRALSRSTWFETDPVCLCTSRQPRKRCPQRSIPKIRALRMNPGRVAPGMCIWTPFRPSIQAALDRNIHTPRGALAYDCALTTSPVSRLYSLPTQPPSARPHRSLLSLSITCTLTRVTTDGGF